MSIRLIAKELYRLIQEADVIKKQIKLAPLLDRATLEEKLKKVLSEQNRIRRALAGATDRKQPKRFLK